MNRTFRRASAAFPGTVGSTSTKPASFPITAAESSRPKILIVASLHKLPYRVLRCAAAAGAEVYVLGDRGARALRLSRYCRRVFLANNVISGLYDDALVMQINCLVRDLGIGMVIPGDGPSTRALVACRDQLTAPIFPLPSLECFDRLNDKWSFTELCGELGIRHPVSRRFEDVTDLSAAAIDGGFSLPAVAKPLSLSGDQGFVLIDGTDTIERLRRIDYRPIIVQDFIAGEDIGASIFARSGELTAFIAHHYGRGVYSTFPGDTIVAELARLAKHLHLDGCYNFDMRMTAAEDIYYLECNPRFFFKIDLSMIAGVNFVALGLPGREPAASDMIRHHSRVYMPKGLAGSPAHWLAVSRKDLAMAAHLCSDPLPALLESVGVLT
jgi:predicted ATP-grasp superfamily ATP-dependent carboligase